MSETPSQVQVLSSSTDITAETSTGTGEKTTPVKALRQPRRSERVRFADLHDKSTENASARIVTIAYVVQNYNEESKQALVNYGAAIFQPPGTFCRKNHHQTAMSRLHLRPNFGVVVNDVETYRDLETQIRKKIYHLGVGGTRIRKPANKSKTDDSAAPQSERLSDQDKVGIRETLRKQLGCEKTIDTQKTHVADIFEKNRIVTLAYQVKAIEDSEIVVTFAAAIYHDTDKTSCWKKNGHHNTARRRLEKSPHRYVGFFFSPLMKDRRGLELAMRFFLHEHGTHHRRNV